MARRLQHDPECPSVSLETTSRSLIPIGMVTLLPDAAQRVRHLERVVCDGFARWGYREIIPPTFEYLDVLSAGLQVDILEKCYKVADWTTGRVFVLRPDVTAQIAKIVAMGLAGQHVPLRLSYRSTVFRYEPEHAGREREVFQLGCELIGADAAWMDAEILVLLIDSLKAVGLTDFKVSLGHVGFYQSLLAQSGLSERGCKQAELAAAHKDLPKLEQLLKRERVSHRQSRTILGALEQCGREEVLEWGRTVAGCRPRLLKPIARLAEVYALLDAAGVRDHLLLDLGEFRGFDYYDGIVFDVFSTNVGCELGGGGRYNHLIGRFGRDLPSTGFALDIDRLFNALDGGGEEKLEEQRVLVVAPASRFQRAFRVSQLLRSHGLVACYEPVPRWDAARLRMIRKQARVADMSWVVQVGPSSASDDDDLVTAEKTRGRAAWTVRIRDLPGLILQQGAYAHP